MVIMRKEKRSVRNMRVASERTNATDDPAKTGFSAKEKSNVNFDRNERNVVEQSRLDKSFSKLAENKPKSHPLYFIPTLIKANMLMATIENTSSARFIELEICE